MTLHASDGRGTKAFCIDQVDLMSRDMCERGTLAREAFENPVDVLRVAGANETNPQATLPKLSEEAATVITPYKGLALLVGPVEVLGSDDVELSAM